MKTSKWSFVTLKRMFKYPYLYLGLILAISIFVYTKWTTVTTREILIDFDDIGRAELFDSINENLYQIVPEAIINIIVPFSMIDTNNINRNYYHYYRPDTLRVQNLLTPFTPDPTKDGYLDSLYDNFKKRTPDSTKSYIYNNKLLVFHDRIQLSFDDWSFLKNYRLDTLTRSLHEPYLLFPYIQEIKRDGNHFKYIIESYHTCNHLFYYSERIGALSKPNWTNKNDLSQFYIKLHIESHSIRSIFFQIDFRGANDFKFIKCQPDSTNGSKITYHFVADTTNHVINEDILIHVHSKELASIQNERVFLLSTLISAIIALALSSIVFKINNLNSKKKSEQNESEQKKSEQNESEKKKSEQNESEKKKRKKKKKK